MAYVPPRIRRRTALWGLVAVLAVLGLLTWWLRPFGEPELKGELTFSTGSVPASTTATASCWSTPSPRTCPA